MVENIFLFSETLPKIVLVLSDRRCESLDRYIAAPGNSTGVDLGAGIGQLDPKPFAR
jgi:hypothetical protein